MNCQITLMQYHLKPVVDRDQHCVHSFQCATSA